MQLKVTSLRSEKLAENRKARLRRRPLERMAEWLISEDRILGTPGRKPRMAVDVFNSNYKTNSSGCWKWTGRISKTGYGIMRYADRPLSAHRVSWVLNFGSIPAGLFVCHRCDVRDCVNPWHLFLGTRMENTDDAIRKGRIGPGVLVGNCKLSESQVVEIRNRRELGESLASIANDFGVTMNCVFMIHRRITWSHLK